MGSNDVTEQGSFRGGGNAHWILIAIIVAVICLTLINKYRETREPDTPAIVWLDDYAVGMGQARDDDKPVLLAFHASWCSPCNKMKRTTYHDPAAIKAVENMICIMVDYDSQKALVQKYRVNGIPSYFVLSSQGEITKQFSGYRSGADFVKQLE